MVERQIMSNERELSFMEAYWDSLVHWGKGTKLIEIFQGKNEGLFGAEKEEWEY